LLLKTLTVYQWQQKIDTGLNDENCVVGWRGFT